MSCKSSRLLRSWGALEHGSIHVAPPSGKIMAEVLLSIKEVEVRRGMGIVLSAYDLDVLAGDILVISGENGSGKSTVIETAARLLPLEKGHVSHHGHLTPVSYTHLTLPTKA